MLKFAAIWVLIYAGGRLPVRLLYALADLTGTLAWLASPRIRAVTRDHMAHIPAFEGEPRARDRAARGCVHSTARYWADFARSAHLEPEAAFEETETVEGLDYLFQARDRGRGVIMFTAHVGMPEFVVRAASHLGLDILAVVEDLDDPRLNGLMLQARTRWGGKFVGANLEGLRATIEHLRRGGLVALVVDRDLQGRGAPTPFFGERALLPTGAVDLALRTGASLLPGFALRTDAGRNRMLFRPPLEFPRTGARERDVEAGMLALARALEEGIVMAPDQWFILQPIWQEPPEPT